MRGVETRRAAVRALCLAGHSNVEIARRLNTAVHVIAYDVRRLREQGVNLPPRRQANASPEHIARVRRLARIGLTAPEIARLTLRRRASIYALAERHGIELNKRSRRS